MIGWKYGSRSATRRDDQGRFLRPNGTSRRKIGPTGRSGSGAIAMLTPKELAEKLVSLEDDCAAFRKRCGLTSQVPKEPSRDCKSIHADMAHTCAVIGDIVRELLEAEPDILSQPKARIATLLLERSGIRRTPRSLGRWPYAEAIEAAMPVQLALPGSKEARVRKRQREHPRRMLIMIIKQKEIERDALDAKCADKARSYAQTLAPLP